MLINAVNQAKAKQQQEEEQAAQEKKPTSSASGCFTFGESEGSTRNG